ncbi:MAG TPA: hypothetical protein VJU02_06535 [Nitrospiraceae bacterium]|nr:hypothetical protein [Nitrospiraceae bacterium]
MVTVTSPAPLLLLAQTLEPPASSLLMPDLIQAEEARHFCWVRLRLAPYTEGDCIEDGSECPNLNGGSDHAFQYTGH